MLTLVSPMSVPISSSSPWMRGAPQSGFSGLILRIGSRVSLDTGGLSGWPRRTFHVQNSNGEHQGALYFRPMATVTEIGSLISRRPNIRSGRPCIAGTGVSVRRIAQWHNMGVIPEEIARKFGYLSLAQVHAALAYYHANQAEIDADLEAEARERARYTLGRWQP